MKATIAKLINTSSEKILNISILEGEDLMIGDILTKSSDPYVICKILNSEGKVIDKFTTKVIKKVSINLFCSPIYFFADVSFFLKKKTLNPVWDEIFRVVLDQRSEDQTLEFEVWDEDLMKKDDFLGMASVEVKNMPSGAFKWLDLTEKPGSKPVGVKGAIKVRVQWENNRIDELKKYCDELYQKILQVTFFHFISFFFFVFTFF